MDTDPAFWSEDGELFEHNARYERLMGKLLYLTVNKARFAFVVGLVSQIMHKPKELH